MPKHEVFSYIHSAALQPSLKLPKLKHDNPTTPLTSKQRSMSLNTFSHTTLFSSCPDLLAAGRELCIAPDATLCVVVALAVAAQIDTVGVHTDVHEVVDNLALDVVLYAVHQETTAYVHHFNEGQISERQNGESGVHTHYTAKSIWTTDHHIHM